MRKDNWLINTDRKGAFLHYWTLSKVSTAHFGTINRIGVDGDRNIVAKGYRKKKQLVKKLVSRRWDHRWETISEIAAAIIVELPDYCIDRSQLKLRQRSPEIRKNSFWPVLVTRHLSRSTDCMDRCHAWKSSVPEGIASLCDLGPFGHIFFHSVAFVWSNENW